jgi:hypothetical protein
MLSGFSPSLLKFILQEKEKEVKPVAAESNDISIDATVLTSDINTNIMDPTTAAAQSAQSTTTVTPYTTLRRVLDDPRYDAVRVILSESEEGTLSNYHFHPTEESPCHKARLAPSPLTLPPGTKVWSSLELVHAVEIFLEKQKSFTTFDIMRVSELLKEELESREKVRKK